MEIQFYEDSIQQISDIFSENVSEIQSTDLTVTKGESMLRKCINDQTICSNLTCLNNLLFERLAF